MAVGVIGLKCGMTRIFDPLNDSSIPVSVVSLQSNKVVQLKTLENDGYNAIQVALGVRRAKCLSKPVLGHYAKANVLPGLALVEFRVDAAVIASIQVGDELRADQFRAGQWVDVTGTTRGHGFSGTVKRHHFKTQPASHGNSLSHRKPGSIGQNQSPGRVFKGKKMAGQYGNTRCTVQSLAIVRVDAERNVLLIKGAIPGAPGGQVLICPSVKRTNTQLTEVA